MGNTSTAWKGLGGRHAMARGVTHGSKERVHPAVPAIGREPSGAVPPVRDQPEARLQMVGEGDWRGEGVGTRSIAASTYVYDAKLRRDRGGGFGGPRCPSGVGRAQDPPPAGGPIRESA